MVDVLVRRSEVGAEKGGLAGRGGADEEDELYFGTSDRSVRWDNRRYCPAESAAARSGARYASQTVAGAKLGTGDRNGERI